MRSLVCWCYMVVMQYTHLLYRHTLVTMSVRKKAKCEETMAVSHSTMESEHCEDEAPTRHSVLVGEHQPLSSYTMGMVITSRKPDAYGHHMVLEHRPYITTDEEYLQRREQMIESWNMMSRVRQL